MANTPDNCGQDDCVGTAGPFTVDGNATQGGTLVIDPSCPPIPANIVDVSQWQLSNSNDSCLIDQYVNEALIIGGAPFNVYKLLGVHEQGKLVDVTGKGKAISNGDLPGFPAANAFDIYQTQWRSIQKGTNIQASAFIGYDFGVIKSVNQKRRMYGIEADVRKHITAFAIKQSANEANRVTTARMERSDDGFTWYGVGIVQLPDDDCLNTIFLRDSVPQRYWRLRPVNFNGGTIDYWGVQAFQMFHDYSKTQPDNIQDKIFGENRDRSYSTDAITLKGSYDLLDVSTELSKFGIELPSQIMVVQFNFLAVVSILGRPLVIGDICELPLEAQFSAELRRIEKWMEVTDVAWSTQGYTPGWHPTMIAVTMQPAIASQETQDLFGDLHEEKVPGGLGLVSRDAGNDTIFQDYFDFSQTAQANAKSQVPEAGAEGSGAIRAWEQKELDNAAAQGLPHLQRFGLNPTGLYVQDAMPPNGAEFTEGNTLPTTGKNGQYFRLIFTGDGARDIPAALYRFSTKKGGWVLLERDLRAQYNPTKPRLEEFLISPTRKPTSKVTK